MVKGPDRVAAAIEWMDLPEADGDERARALCDLARINRLFGGTRLILHHLASLLPGLPSPVRILDVATGYADIPRVIARWARRHGLRAEIVGLDHQAKIVELAAQASRQYPEISLRVGEARALPYPNQSFDIVLASQVLHHMEGDDPVRLLRELYRVARRAVLVGDLRRGRCPFLVTWVGLRLISRSRLIHHDGPLSIRRGFLDKELEALAGQAEWTRVRVSRHPFFRLALIGEKG